MPGQTPSFTNASLWQMPQASTLIGPDRDRAAEWDVRRLRNFHRGLLICTAFMAGVTSFFMKVSS